MPNTLLFFVSIIILMVWQLDSARADSVSSIQEHFYEISTKLANNEIAKVDIENLPSSILTRTRLTPEMLDKQFEYKTTIRDLRGNTYKAQLSEAVKSTVLSPSQGTADIRWGIIFFDIHDQRVGAIYFNSNGSQGSVDNQPVSISGKLFKWLSNNFSEAFR